MQKIINWRLPTLKELENIDNHEDFISLDALSKNECFLWTSELTSPSSGDLIYNTYDILNHKKGSSFYTDKNTYLLLVSEDEKGDIIYFDRNFRFDKPIMYQDAIVTFNEINLKNAIFNFADPKTKELHLLKIGEKSSELNHRIFQTVNGKSQTLDYNSNLLDGIADVLNSVEVYLKAIDIDKEDLSLYRLNHLKKYFK